MTTLTSDQEYQDHILPGVSRTFALTIPQLPAGLRDVVANAYLLCRIADVIEDNAVLPAAEKQTFHDRFVAVVEGRTPSEALSRDLAPHLSAETPPAERDLIANIGRVVALTRSYRPCSYTAIARCLRIMCHGMPEFQRRIQPSGLVDVAELDLYCYYVAGVVGEMLTELFCDYSPRINRQRETLMALAPSFGQGLQMTNILKDVWKDRTRGACWLPRDIFNAAGCDLGSIADGHHEQAFSAGMKQLIAIAHSHLQDGLNYTLRIPAEETGIRQFCLWALGMAVMSLRKVHRNPALVAGAQVKISRKTVKATIVITNMAIRRDQMLRTLFRWSSYGLPVP